MSAHSAQVDSGGIPVTHAEGYGIVEAKHRAMYA